MRLPSPLPALIVAASLPFGLAACASQGPERLPFTDGLSAAFQLDDADKQNLQYYASEQIRLVRGASASELGIHEGVLVSHDVQDSDTVVIDKGTPGVVVASGPNWMAVSFSPDTYLYFVSDIQRSPWRGRDYVPDRYYLYLPQAGVLPGPVPFDGGYFNATGNSYRAFLVVGRERFRYVTSREAKLPGRTLQDE